jgi:branched-subunit amino acid transport protein
MSPTEIWLSIAGITLATVLTRAGLLVLDVPVRLPPKVEMALRYAPVCALTGIIVPELLVADGGAVELGWSNIRLFAACAAVAIFLTTRSVLGTIAGGMGVFWLLQAFVGGGS